MERPRCEQAGTRIGGERLERRVARAANCRRGATVLQFAIVSTMLIPVLMTAMEMGWQAAAAVMLDGAAFNASRTGSLGRLHADGTRSGEARASDVIKAAKGAGRGLFDRGKLTLKTTHYGDSYSAGADTYRTKGTDGAGSGGHTVVYELTYEHPFLFAESMMGRAASVHTITFVVQNEPFNEGKADAPPCP